MLGAWAQKASRSTELWSIIPSPAEPGAFVTVHDDGVRPRQYAAPALCRHVLLWP